MESERFPCGKASPREPCPLGPPLLLALPGHSLGQPKGLQAPGSADKPKAHSTLLRPLPEWGTQRTPATGFVPLRGH